MHIWTFWISHWRFAHTDTTHLYLLILAPGGIISQDGAPRSPFSIFAAEDNTETIKKHVEVFDKLIRRYRYLQHIFEDTLRNLLQYINKWSTEEINKLATAIGLLTSGGLANVNVLTVLFKEHLVKEGKELHLPQRRTDKLLDRKTNSWLRWSLTPTYSLSSINYYKY